MDESVDEDTRNFPERINFSRTKIQDLLPSNTWDILFTSQRTLSSFKVNSDVFGSKKSPAPLSLLNWGLISKAC